jgi:photosystem II stability/assembly factor-like uncharacterized protein
VVKTSPHLARAFAALAVCFALLSGARAQPHWVPLDRPTTHNLRAVWFADTLRGWVGGDSGVILSTADGGNSWTFRRAADSVTITDIFSIDTLRAWATAIRPLVDPGDWAGSLLYRTSDGGATWTGQSYPDTFFNTIFFFDSLNGWAGGEQGLILRTTDGGLSWSAPTIQSTIYSTFPVKRISFYSPGYGYAVGGYPESAGVIWRTTDGGMQWSVTGLGDALRAIHYVDSLEVVFTGGGFDDGACVTRTSDGGAGWSFSYVGPFGFGTSMASRSASEWWVPLGFAGTSMATFDGGETWAGFTNPGTVPSYGISFPGPRHGYMAGDSGTVLRYNAPVAVGVGPGWNIVSLPVETTERSKDSLFPGAASPAYEYGPGGYAVVDMLRPGRGYWLKFPGPASSEFIGYPREADTVVVAEGWNMIGSLSVTADAAGSVTDPPGIRTSPFYGFEGGYGTADTLLPGKGYWVKVTSDGLLILKAAD